MSNSSMEYIFQKMIRAGEAVNKKGNQIKNILADTENVDPDLETEVTLNVYLITLDKTIARLQFAIQSFVEEKEKYMTANKKEMEEASRRMAEAVEIMASGEEIQSSGLERIEKWKSKKLNQQTVKKEAGNKLEEEVSNTKNPENLPQIKIPHFDGNINKFKNFWAIFENSIHKTELSNMTKFTYLHYYLKGSAAKLIQRYDVTGENYDAAVALLKKRYDNQKLVIYKMNEELLRLRALSDQIKDQQKMFDNIFVLVDQLQRRGETMDVSLVKSMIIEKFSAKIQEKIIQRKANDSERVEDWTLTKLLAEIKKILKCERKLARVHESFRKNSPPGLQPGKHVVNNRIGKKHPSGGSNFENSTSSAKSKQNGFTPVCKLCEIEGHHVFNCDKYSTPQIRRAFLKTKKGTCWNCLANNHDTKECRSKMSCKHCNSRHHSSLCLAGRKETQSEKNATPGELITLKIKAYNQKLREWQNVSVFLDNGSSNSYVTRSLTENWELEKVGFTWFGMQTFSRDIEDKPMDVAKIILQEASGAVRSLNLIVTEKMTRKISKAKLTDQDMEYIEKMRFAINSETFDSHSEPDITIGMDYYNDIQNGTVDLPSGIKLIKTIYGCTTMGRPSETQKSEYESMSFNNSIVAEENSFQMEFEKLGQEEFTRSLKDEKRIENEKVHENFKRTIEKKGRSIFCTTTH